MKQRGLEPRKETKGGNKGGAGQLAAWPINVPVNWLERVNQTDDEPELESLRRSAKRGRLLASPNGGRKSRIDWV